MKLSTAIRRYDAQLRADGKSPHTRTVYLRDLEFFARWAGQSKDISKITPHHLNRFLTSRIFTHTVSGKQKEVISLNRSKSALRSFFRFLTDAGHIKQNPARLVRSAPCHQKPPSCLSSDEAQQLLATMRKEKTPIAERDHLMFALMLGTGIRLGSLVGLNVNSVDIDSGTIRVNGKGNVEQLLYLTPRLRRLINPYLADRPDRYEPLFLSTVGRRIGPRQIQLRFGHWLVRAGIERKASVHSLRHSFASFLYEKTGDLRLAQVALGHRSISTTEIYPRVPRREVEQALRSIGDGFIANRRQTR